MGNTKKILVNLDALSNNINAGTFTENNILLTDKYLQLSGGTINGSLTVAGQLSVNSNATINGSLGVTDNITITGSNKGFKGNVVGLSTGLAVATEDDYGDLTFSTINTGNSSTPVYFSNGIPTACDISGDYVAKNIEITSNTNLNDILNVGFYVCNSDSIAATVTNYPTTHTGLSQTSFSLIVEKHAGYKQTLTTYSTTYPKICVRNYYGESGSGTWGDWYIIYNSSDTGFIPTKLPNPYSLTISNGGMATLYDGSAAVSLTYSSIGAAPVDHASEDSDYGMGNVSYYGHVKLCDELTGTIVSGYPGLAATPYLVNNVKSELEGSISQLNDTYAPVSHTSSTGTYGGATGALYGHVKLSDSVNGDLDCDTGFTAFTPYGAYTLQQSLQSSISTLKASIEDSLSLSYSSNSATVGLTPTVSLTYDGELLSSFSLPFATDTVPGILSNGTQTISGDKTFTGSITGNVNGGCIKLGTFNTNTFGDLVYSNLSIGSASAPIYLEDGIPVTCTLNDTYAPISHTSSTGTYGGATGALYGHVKLSDSVEDDAGSYSAAYGFTAFTPYGAYALQQSLQSSISTLKTSIEDSLSLSYSNPLIIGSTPTVSLTYDGGILSSFSLPFATDTVPGILSNASQTISGDKTFTGNVTATNFYKSSDRNLKENIQEISEVDLQNVENIKAVQYNFKNCVDTQFGYIAQDIEEFFPNVVNTDKDGIKSLDYIQLLVIENQYLKNKLQELEYKINSLL